MTGPSRSQWVLIAGLVAFFVLIVGGGVGLQAWRTGRSPVVAGPSEPAVSIGQYQPQRITAGQPLVFGSVEAPVRLGLYEDFHCPHCAEFEEQYGPTLKAAVGSGQARIELYPMAFIDEGSAAAANAMACAAEVDAGERYYAGLFANHTLRWSDGQLLELGELTGTTLGTGFESCVRTDAHAAWVDSINAAAAQNGVTSTPSLLLNGTPVDLTTTTPESLAAMIASAGR